MARPSQKVTEQAALTTSKGGSWLVVGAALTVLCAAILALLWDREPAGTGITGAGVVLALYAAIVVIRFAVPPGRRRLGTMAVLTILIPATFLVCGVVILAAG